MHTMHDICSKQGIRYVHILDSAISFGRFNRSFLNRSISR